MSGTVDDSRLLGDNDGTSKDWVGIIGVIFGYVTAIGIVVGLIVYGSILISGGQQYHRRMQAVPCQVQELYANQTRQWLWIRVGAGTDSVNFTDTAIDVQDLNWFTFDPRTCYRHRDGRPGIDYVNPWTYSTTYGALLVAAAAIVPLLVWAGSCIDRAVSKKR